MKKYRQETNEKEQNEGYNDTIDGQHSTLISGHTGIILVMILPLGQRLLSSELSTDGITLLLFASIPDHEYWQPTPPWSKKGTEQLHHLQL